MKTFRLPVALFSFVTDLSPDLASRIQQGSLDALEELYRTASTDLLRLPAAMIAYQERGQLIPWLRRVTARTVMQRSRSRRRYHERDGRYAAERPRTTGGGDGAVTVDDALARLPLPLRSVVVLKDLEGMSHGEIAKTLGISAPGTHGCLGNRCREGPAGRWKRYSG
jgi:DNA-directed RNA polymerase specialized sigma24 family protein